MGGSFSMPTNTSPYVVLPPRTPDWPTRLAANPGPVDPFPYPGPDVIVSTPADPFARARAQHARRRLVMSSPKPSRYSTIKRALGL